MAIVISGSNGISTDGTNIGITPTTIGMSRPNLPSFLITGTATPFSTANAIVPFNTAIFNQGSYFNTSTYRFTAPVAGNYYFVVWGIIGLSSGFNCALYVRKNGATIATLHRNDTSSNTWEQTSASAIVYMNVGDYCDVITDGAATIHLNYYSCFSGFLLG